MHKVIQILNIRNFVIIQPRNIAEIYKAFDDNYLLLGFSVMLINSLIICINIVPISGAVVGSVFEVEVTFDDERVEVDKLGVVVVINVVDFVEVDIVDEEVVRLLDGNDVDGVVDVGVVVVVGGDDEVDEGDGDIVEDSVVIGAGVVVVVVGCRVLDDVDETVVEVEVVGLETVVEVDVAVGVVVDLVVVDNVVDFVVVVVVVVGVVVLEVVVVVEVVVGVVVDILDDIVEGVVEVDEDVDDGVDVVVGRVVVDVVVDFVVVDGDVVLGGVETDGVTETKQKSKLWSRSFNVLVFM